MNSEKQHTASQNGKSHLSRGFSLVEILIVLALIGLLAGLVVTNLDKILGGGKEKAAKNFVTTSLETPLSTYMLDVGQYPTSLKDLVTNPGKGKKWKGPYIKQNKVPVDPWANEYQYRTPAQKNSGGGYDLWSNGPDGSSGSADDIGNWD
jgi:general secretion pathway protein G